VIGGLSAARREGLHLEVAQAIERVCGDKLEDHVSELAYHYARSANALKAVEYLTQAAQWACNRHSAYKEADVHLRTAFSLIERLPEGDRASHEVRLLLPAGEVARALKGFFSAELRDVGTLALELARGSAITRRSFNSEICFIGTTRLQTLREP
jgi:predicted ATPase